MTLKNIKIAKKISGGFAVVLILMVCLAGFTGVSLRNIEHMFTEYRNLAREAVELGRVQANLLEARLATMYYLKSGDVKAIDTVEQRGKVAIGLAKHAETLTTDPAVTKDLKNMQVEFANYLDAFHQIVAFQNQRNAAYEILKVYGPKMEQDLAEIMETAHDDHDIEAAYNAGAALRHVLLARVYVTKFLVDNDEPSRKRVDAELEKSAYQVRVMQASLQDRQRQNLARQFLKNEKTYIKAFHEIVVAINKRNETFASRLSAVGPHIAKEIEHAKLETKKVQDRIGPQVAKEIGQSVTLSVVISVVALVCGIAAAWLIGRGINGPIRHMTGVMRRLAQKDMSVDVPEVERRDEIGDMAQAVLVFKDNMIKADELAMQQEAENLQREQRVEKIATLNADFDAGVAEILESVGQASRELQATAQTMNSIADDSLSRSEAVAAAAEQSLANVQTVSASADALSASISEIGGQVQKSTGITSAATQQAQETHKKIQGLSVAVDKIDDVVHMITDIAEQTNLLALNATIEAARAGDAGKGFAVVANEVKNLANQTARATDDIARQIGAVQTQTRSSVDAINQIVDVIEDINQVSSAIAAAVEEQNAATMEIARNVEEAAIGTKDVTTNIAGVSQAAGEAGAASTQVLTASENLAAQSETLRRMVQKFLTDVRNA